MLIPDAVYKWLVNFFSERKHCTRYGGCTFAGDAGHLDQYYSRVRSRSGVLCHKHWWSGNCCTSRIHKYADDTYIIIPASNVQHREAELEHVAQWAQANDLKLNRTKSVEVIFSSRRKPQECHPPKLLDICHVTTITILSILGITLIIISMGRLKTREWKMRHEHNCMGGKCRSGKCGIRLQGWKMQEWKMQ